MLKEINTLSKKEREKIIEKIKKQLSQKKEIIFAYLYGSFLKDPFFRDIDIGIYLNEKKIKKSQFFRYQLKIIKELKIPAKYPIDLKILNEAPNSFLSAVFSHGKLLFSKNDKFLTDLIEEISSEEISSEAFSLQSFKELIS